MPFLKVSSYVVVMPSIRYAQVHWQLQEHSELPNQRDRR